MGLKLQWNKNISPEIQPAQTHKDAVLEVHEFPLQR